jgi:hypothetical protein
MKCPDCGKVMRKVMVKIEDADSLVATHQCACGNFCFEDDSIRQALKEINHLKIRQRVVKISKNRLGMYFNRDVVRCLGLEGGEDIYVSMPAKNKVLIEMGNS